MKRNDRSGEITDGENEGVTRRDILSQQGGATPRRSFVGTVVGSVTGALTATAGFSKPGIGTAARREERKAAASEYHSTEAVNEAVTNYAADVLNTLADNGVLATPSIAELPTETLYAKPSKYADADEGTVVFGIHDDDSVIARIQIMKRVSDNARLVVVVVPAREHSFAVVESETPTMGMGSRTRGTEAVTQDCGGCYYDEYCWVGCAPDSCECLIHQVPCCTSVGCDGCCYVTNNVCSPCSEDGAC